MFVAVGGHAAQQGEGRAPEHVVPNLEPAGQEDAQQQNRHMVIGPFGIINVPGVEAEHHQHHRHHQHQAVPYFIVKQLEEKLLHSKQQEHHGHAAECAAAAGDLVGKNSQRGQAHPVDGAQFIVPQPAPGEEHARQPRAEAVVVAVAEIPVAAVEIVGHQRGSKVQQLHHQQARHGRSQIDAKGGFYVDVFRAQPHQCGQEKPYIIAVPGGKSCVGQHQRRQNRLPAGLVVCQ